MVFKHIYSFAFLSLIFALQKAVETAPCTTCPEAWVTFGESCYYFGHGQGMSFTESEHFCLQRNSHLVHVNNARENAFLKDYLTRLIRPKHRVVIAGRNYWMGLTDEKIEGIYTWMDDGTDVEFTDWYPGQPDDYNHSEDCVIFWEAHDFLWDDAGCTSSSCLPICEMPAGPGEQVVVG